MIVTNFPPGRKTDTFLAFVGFLVALPAMYFFTGSFLKYELNLFPNTVILVPPPIVMIGGLLLAILLNVYPIIRHRAGEPNSALMWIPALKAVRWNASMVFLGALFLFLLVGYVLVENILEMNR